MQTEGMHFRKIIATYLAVQVPYSSHYTCLIASQLCSLIISQLVKARSLRRCCCQCWWLQSTPQQFSLQKHDVRWPSLLCMKWSKSDKMASFPEVTQKSFSLFFSQRHLQWFSFFPVFPMSWFLLPGKTKIRALTDVQSDKNTFWILRQS